ncbi:DUF4348 domain-containing protein [Winogradskyella forsetii]|uniref:DUF4348 domain-containing protein n=1 Tax=Winogradskyella forsetii TaxID=2686077 RepID=UPI0015BD8621|nr:DUF4348 domain-containing protein [Winogradskyella forsetii]
MKNTLKLIILGTLISTFVCCKQNNKTEKEAELNKISDSTLLNQTNSELKTIKSSIPENIDSEFKIFLEYFNKDSIFQISRVNFPIKSKQINYENYGTIEKITDIDNYEIIDLTIDPSSETKEYDKYTQKTILKEFKAVIEIRGIDNGINCDYEFEKINGKWKLTTWSNLST